MEDKLLLLIFKQFKLKLTKQEEHLEIDNKVQEINWLTELKE